MFDKFRMKMAFNLSRRLKFYRTMARQTDEKRRGQKPIVILTALIKQQECRNKEKPTTLSKLYRNIRSRLELGRKVGEVLQDYVPATEASQIYAAEVSGKITDGFKMAMDVAQQQTAFTKAFKDALIGPIINLLLSFGILTMFFKTLVPSMLNNSNQEQMSILLICLSTVSQHFDFIAAVVVTVIILLALWLRWALPNYNGSFRLLLDKYPPFSMYKIMTGCSFLYALNALMKSRVPQNKALETIKEFAAPYLKLRINKILEQTNRTLGEAIINMNMDFPDREVIDEMAMASDQGILSEALPDIISSLNVDGIELVKLQSQILKGVTLSLVIGSMMLMLGGMFGFLANMPSS